MFSAIRRRNFGGVVKIPSYVSGGEFWGKLSFGFSFIFAPWEISFRLCVQNIFARLSNCILRFPRTILMKSDFFRKECFIKLGIERKIVVFCPKLFEWFVEAEFQLSLRKFCFFREKNSSFPDIEGQFLRFSCQNCVLRVQRRVLRKNFEKKTFHHFRTVSENTSVLCH